MKSRFAFFLGAAGATVLFFALPLINGREETHRSRGIWQHLDFPKDQRGLFASEGQDIFESALHCRMNNFDILSESENYEHEKRVYVLHEGKLILATSPERTEIYHAAKPPIDAYARVIVEPTGMRYGGDGFSFHDFGFDGPDLAFENTFLTNSEFGYRSGGGVTHHLPDLECNQLNQELAEIACCRHPSSDAWDAWIFHARNGWIVQPSTSKATVACRSKPEISGQH